jgi:hypothetical protein
MYPVNRQVAAMDARHRTGIGNYPREMNVPVVIAAGTHRDSAVQCVK